MLTQKELEKIIFGTVKICDEGDGWNSLHRLTDKQIETAETERDRPLRPYAAAGVRLDIVGEVTEISFAYQIFPGSSRRFYSFDVWEDGVLTEHVYFPTNRALDSYQYKPKAKGRITIYFPNLTAVWLKDVEIKGEYQPYVYPHRILIFGDSITQGYDAAYPSESYANAMARAFDADCLNEAIGGDYFDTGIIDTDIDYEPDLITMAYGTNDWSHDADVPTTSRAFFSLLRSRYPKTPMIAFGPVWRGDINKERKYTLHEIADQIHEACQEFSIAFVDGKDFIPHDPAFFSPDVLHPNDAGFAHQAKAVIAAIRAQYPQLF